MFIWCFGVAVVFTIVVAADVSADIDTARCLLMTISGRRKRRRAWFWRRRILYYSKQIIMTFITCMTYIYTHTSKRRRQLTSDESSSDWLMTDWSFMVCTAVLSSPPWYHTPVMATTSLFIWHIVQRHLPRTFCRHKHTRWFNVRAVRVYVFNSKSKQESEQIRQLQPRTLLRDYYCVKRFNYTNEKVNDTRDIYYSSRDS